MTPDPAWKYEVGLAAVSAAALALVGLALGHPLLVLLLGAIGYLAWHLAQLRNLSIWLKNATNERPPAVAGIWGSVYSQIYRRQQRSQKRKRKLGRTLRRFNEATAALPDATVILGKEGEIEWWNHAAGRLLGLTRPTDRGQRITYFIRHPDFARRLDDNDWSPPLVIGSPRDESKVLSISTVQLGKKKALLIARDVTRVHQLEQIRRDFVANVSHELRTPLTVVSGYVESLLDSAESKSPLVNRALPQLHAQTRRMQGIVRDLLVLCRLEREDEARDHEPIPMMSLLNSIREDAVEMGREKGLHVQMDADPGLGLVGEASELRSAFLNLVVNAARFTPEGGRVDIRWYADDDGAHFSVSDNGIGIDPKHIPRLTERFYRVDVGRSRDSGGTGLGLAIVKHALTRHDGALRVESELGKGSTFTCDFPYHYFCTLRRLEAATATPFAAADG